jgi:preprotein translocase subunit SecG
VFALKITLGIVYLLICVALVVVTLLQDPKQEGVSALSGQTDSFFNKNKGGTKEAFLSKLTVLLGVLFAVVAIVLTAIIPLG